MQTSYSTLMWAAGGGEIATVKFLVEETTAEVNATDIVSHSDSSYVLSAKAVLLELLCVCAMELSCTVY